MNIGCLVKKHFCELHTRHCVKCLGLMHRVHIVLLMCNCLAGCATTYHREPYISGSSLPGYRSLQSATQIPLSQIKMLFIREQTPCNLQHDLSSTFYTSILQDHSIELWSCQFWSTCDEFLAYLACFLVAI